MQNHQFLSFEATEGDKILFCSDERLKQGIKVVLLEVKRCNDMFCVKSKG